MAELGERAGNAGTQGGGKAIDSSKRQVAEVEQRYRRPGGPPGEPGGLPGRRRGRGGELGYNINVMLFHLNELKFSFEYFSSIPI